MKANAHQSNIGRTSLIAVAALVTTLAFSPAAVYAAEKDAHEDRAEQRIKDMHQKLKITAAQEEQWKKVKLVMLDDAKTMDHLTQARADHASDVNAVGNLKSYGEITEAHADGIKKLIPAFADLYASMSDVQKKEADTLFRRQGHEAHKLAHKKMESK